MPTPAYVPLDPNKPDGATQAPVDYAASDLANVRALRDMVVSGLGDTGWDFSISPAGFQNPTFYLWKNAATGQRLRANMTYAGAPAYGPATVTWQWSNDAGATYQQIGAVVNITTDAAGVINAASSLAGGFITALAARAMSMYQLATLNAHAALIGTAAHGLGTMSTQNANAVAVTGGTIANAALTNSSLGSVPRIFPANPPGLVSGAAWNWAATPSQVTCPPGTIVAQITNASQGEVKRIWVTGAGAITINSGAIAFQWGQGQPTYGPLATLVSLVCVAGNFVIGSSTPV